MTKRIAQQRWRNKYSQVKRQLNVMARRQTHDALSRIAAEFGLKGKGEAVAFVCFATQGLMQRAEYDPDAARVLRDLAEGYRLHRELHAA